MQTDPDTQTLPFQAGDAEWVADLFDTLQAGDLDVMVGQIEELLRVMRQAAKARCTLATLEPALLREGLALCIERGRPAR